jgi:hypothetical protein
MHRVVKNKKKTGEVSVTLDVDGEHVIHIHEKQSATLLMDTNQNVDRIVPSGARLTQTQRKASLHNAIAEVFRYSDSLAQSVPATFLWRRRLILRQCTHNKKLRSKFYLSVALNRCTLLLTVKKDHDAVRLFWMSKMHNK